MVLLARQEVTVCVSVQDVVHTVVMVWISTSWLLVFMRCFCGQKESDRALSQLRPFVVCDVPSVGKFTFSENSFAPFDRLLYACCFEISQR